MVPQQCQQFKESYAEFLAGLVAGRAAFERVQERFEGFVDGTFVQEEPAEIHDRRSVASFRPCAERSAILRGRTSQSERCPHAVGAGKMWMARDQGRGSLRVGLDEQFRQRDCDTTLAGCCP